MSEAAPPTLPRVLVVDDSRMVRATIVKHIRGRFDVREEGDGEAGWQTLMLDPTIQVVISDLSMPKLDGYGLLARIRDSKIVRIREMPVIMISGDEDESARNRAKECGATDFIMKGIGTVELVSRLDALVKLAQTRSELEAMAKNVMVDPESGLPTEEYLKQQGRQALAHAQRHGGEISVIVIEIDRFDRIAERFGRQIGEQLIRQFRMVLSRRVRLEDTVSQTGPNQFKVVCPGNGLNEARAFASRLDQIIRNATITYRGERVEIGLKFGFANSRNDDWQSMTSLLQLAAGRADGGVEAAALIPAEAAALPSEPRPGFDQALALIEAGNVNALRPHLAALGIQLLPLLKLLDSEHRLDLPLDDVERKLRG
jgi:diguanylate cyclase (GGDEF)-like protein